MKSRAKHRDITPEQSRAARALLGITQPELATLSNLGLATIVRLERGAGDLHYTTPGRIEAALAERGITLLNDDMGSGVRFDREAQIPLDSVAAEVLTPGQCRAARALLGMSSRELAKLLRVNKGRVEAAEMPGAEVGEAVLRRLRATFVVRGILFRNEPSTISVQLRRSP
jgi:transcriptional regulator with XRE-family HTH domain